jgi:hypothetical protein
MHLEGNHRIAADAVSDHKALAGNRLHADAYALSLKSQKHLESQDSVATLVTKGLLRDVSVPSEVAKADEKRKDSIEKIKVVYSDRSNDPAHRKIDADFRVKKDGTIEVLNDPDKHNRKELVVEVERDQGQITAPSNRQKNSAGEVVTYLAERYMKRNRDGTRAGVIEDPQDLVADSVQKAIRARPTHHDRLPEPARRQVSNMQRFEGGGRGTMSPEQVDSYFTPRDQVPQRQQDETNDRWSLKETVAAMLTHGEARPYEAAYRTESRGYAVGRYALTCDMLMDWLSDLMGDPPDPARLDEAVKKGKISAAMAQKLKSPQFQKFVESLRNNQAPSAGNIKEFLPAELQESIGGHFIEKFAEQSKDAQGKIDPAKVTLAMSLGRMPTDDDLAKPENREFTQATQRLAEISSARTANPGQSLEWQEVNQRVLLAAKQSLGKPMWSYGPWSHAKLEYGNLGCAASVSEVMETAGVPKSMFSAGCILLEEKIIKSGGHRVANPQPGDLVFGRRGPGKHGHVGIVGEDGKVYHNNSGKKYWVEAGLDKVFNRKRGFIDIHYVRLPDIA